MFITQGSAFRSVPASPYQPPLALRLNHTRNLGLNSLNLARPLILWREFPAAAFAESDLSDTHGFGGPGTLANGIRGLTALIGALEWSSSWH